MNENFKKQISDLDELTEIAQIVSESVELKERVSKYSIDSTSPLLKDSKSAVPLYFKEKGSTIYIVGECSQGKKISDKMVEKIGAAATLELIDTLHIADRGLFISLIEACSVNKLGFDITTISEIEEKEFLFNEGYPLLIVALSAETESLFVDLIYNSGIEITLLGHVTKGEIRIDDTSFGYIKKYID